VVPPAGEQRTHENQAGKDLALPETHRESVPCTPCRGSHQMLTTSAAARAASAYSLAASAAPTSSNRATVISFVIPM
jgi:hypothetical protein